jgi:hypothetical protein
MRTIDKDNVSQWISLYNEATFKDINQLLDRTDFSMFQGQLVKRFSEEYLTNSLLSCTHWLALTYYAITGKWKPAVPLGSVCSMIWAGAHCFDDLNDGDLSSKWNITHAGADASITSFTFATLLTQERLRTIRMPVKRYKRVQEITSRGLLNLLGAQLEDIHATGDYHVDLKSVEASVMQREPWGIFMRLGAEFAGASPEVVEAYGVFGDYLGLSGSLRKDYQELHRDPECRDLKNGTCTLYLTSCLAQMEQDERSEFVETLQLAREDDEARSRVKKQLAQGRFMQSFLALLKGYRIEPMKALDIASPPEPLRLIFKDALMSSTYP